MVELTQTFGELTQTFGELKQNYFEIVLFFTLIVTALIITGISLIYLLVLSL